MASFLSIKVSPNRYEDFEVPNEVAIYVKQLEIALSNTNDTNITKTALMKLYPNRFNYKGSPYDI
jgi:hypothetical protein